MSTVNASFTKLLDYERRAAVSTEAQTVSQDSAGDWSALAFRVGNMRLVCGMDRVHESLTLPTITRVPGTKPFIVGLANVRGDLMTVVDLGRYIDGMRTPPGPQSRLLAATLRGRPVGLLVDEVFGPRNFVQAEAVIEDVEEGSPFHGLIRSLRRSGSDEWRELDIDGLFNQPEFLDGAAS